MLRLQQVTRPIPWARVQEQFPCPDVIWQGIWKEASELIGARGWDVWAGIYSALCARAGRLIHWHYYKSPMFGMSYVLVLAPTASGKEFCLNICNALLPENYPTRKGVQSGPALFPMLADMSVRKTPRPAVPTILLMGEWAKLVRMAGVQHSTLVEELNDIFHTGMNWNVSRSNREFAGGDQVMKPPVLSILGVTTPEAMLENVSTSLVNNGFINRYLVLPGPMDPWVFWPRQRIADPMETLVSLKTRLDVQCKDAKWGKGRYYHEAFSPAAERRMEVWGPKFFQPFMEENTIQANRKKRLHMYASHIPIISAWSRWQPDRPPPQVEESDIEMVIPIIETASKFLDLLYEIETLPVSALDIRDYQLEQLIEEKIRAEPGVYTIEALQKKLKRAGATYSRIQQTIQTMMTARVVTKDPKTFGLILQEQQQEYGKRNGGAPEKVPPGESIFQS